MPVARDLLSRSPGRTPVEGHSHTRLFSASEVFFLIAAITIALLLRLDFIWAASGTIDGDEAIVGLMGKHILEGRNIPVFYYGQHYMGSLEALMASISFFIFGISPMTLQLVPLTFSLVLIPLVYLLGRTVMSTRCGAVAALLTAVPPPALVVWSSKARGGFIEVVVLGTLALLITALWYQKPAEKLRYPAAIGFILGVGWWVNNQIAYFVIPIALCSLIHTIGRPIQTDPPTAACSNRFLRLVTIVLTGLASFLIGGIPYWLYNIKHGFPSAGMFSLSKYEVFREHLDGLRFTALPMLVGARRFWQKEPAFSGAMIAAYSLYVAPIAIVGLVRLKAELALFIGRLDRRNPVELISLFCVSCCLIFALSSYGWLVQAPRYLLPLYVGLFILLGVCYEYLARLSKLASLVFVAAVITFHIVSSYYPERATAGEPVVYAGQRVARDHGPLIETLDSLGITKIRTNYWIGYRLAFETHERVTFVMLAEPDQIRIPEYQNSGDTPHDLLPLVLVQSEASIIRPAMAKAGLSFSETRVGEYVLFHTLRRLFPDTSVLPSSVIESASAEGSQRPEGAFDGDRTTRWGTGKPQVPGQKFILSIAPGVLIDGLRQNFGLWQRDLAKSLSIEATLADGSTTTLLSPGEYRGIRYLGWGEGGFEVRFQPLEVRSLTFTNIGSDPTLDWSIAELQLLGDMKEHR
jgi:hypothetical protein